VGGVNPAALSERRQTHSRESFAQPQVVVALEQELRLERRAPPLQGYLRLEARFATFWESIADQIGDRLSAATSTTSCSTCLSESKMPKFKVAMGSSLVEIVWSQIV
jgi:hypothetical protein